LKEEQQAECVRQTIQAQQVNQDDGGEAHVGARGSAEDGAIHTLPRVAGAKLAQSNRYKSLSVTN